MVTRLGETPFAVIVIVAVLGAGDGDGEGDGCVGELEPPPPPQAAKLHAMLPATMTAVNHLPVMVCPPLCSSRQ
jgi:hypothetical protein